MPEIPPPGVGESDDCCDSSARLPAKRPMLCPECGERATQVTSEPVRFYAQDPSAITKGTYYFCKARGCNTVYFDAEGARLTRDALTVRIGVKEERAPHLVCYCFGHTEEAMEAEFRIHGKTTIPERIRAEIEAGTCECEFRNPAGRCCLGEVTQTMKRLGRIHQTRKT